MTSTVETKEKCQKIGWEVNDKLDRMWNKVLMV